MAAIDGRLRAVCDLMVADARGNGRHEYDGEVQDLSPEGVRAGLGHLGRLRPGDRRDDPYDEALLSGFEQRLRVELGELELHRRSPLLHLANLDLSGYAFDYAPEEERRAARQRHLARWPDAIDAAIASLDAVAAPVAAALLEPVRALRAGVTADDEAAEQVLAAHARLVSHLEHLASNGDPDVALGASALARLFGAHEAMAVDLDALAHEADAERDRLMALLREACARLDPARPVEQLVPALLLDHPDADGVIDEARAVVDELLAFTSTHELAPHHDGTCLVGPAPATHAWAQAWMAWAGADEADRPSWYWVTPPDPSWPEEDAQEWLSVFSRTTLPAVTAHEVAPGHFAHGRSLRRAPTAERRLLQSTSFIEGWAHYGEELCVEAGFRSGDPRFAIGVYLEALIRVTRLACAIGLQTGTMDVEAATSRFAADAFMRQTVAASEARRGTFDPTYGRYTWGKLAIRTLRDEAKAVWGEGYTLQRFHRAMLDLGSPPLGLLHTAIERG